jgi:hypothetical protein
MWSMERQNSRTVDDLVAAVIRAPGQTSATERQAMFEGAAIAGPLGAYSAKVRAASFRITESDIDRLREAGVEEDAILEATLASAVGAASSILERGLRALEAG